MWNVSVCSNPRKHWVGQKWGVLSGNSLNDMLGTNFGLQKDNGKNVDYEGTESKKSNGDKEKKSEEPNNSGVIHKNRNKVGTVSLSRKKENESSSTSPSKTESLLKDAAKVGSGLGAGALGLKGVQVAVNKAKGKDKQSVSENTGYNGDIKKSEKERDEAIARERTTSEALPEKTRIWLFGFLSYLFKHLGILGEGEKGAGFLAEHDKGTRFFILLFLFAYTLLDLWIVYEEAIKNAKRLYFLALPFLSIHPLAAFLSLGIIDRFYCRRKMKKNKDEKNLKSNLPNNYNIYN